MKTKLLKLFFGIFLQMAFSYSVAFGQSCPAPPPAFEKSELVGTWEGTYTLEGKSYALKTSILLNGEQLSAQVTSKDLKLKNADFMTWICQSNEVHMRMDLPGNKAIKMIGRLNRGVLSGRFVPSQASNVCGISRERFTMQKTGTKITQARIFKF